MVSESHGTAITSLAHDPPDHGERHTHTHTHDVAVLVSEIKTTLSNTIKTQHMQGP